MACILLFAVTMVALSLRKRADEKTPVAPPTSFVEPDVVLRTSLIRTQTYQYGNVTVDLDSSSLAVLRPLKEDSPQIIILNSGSMTVDATNLDSKSTLEVETFNSLTTTSNANFRVAIKGAIRTYIVVEKGEAEVFNMNGDSIVVQAGEGASVIGGETPIHHIDTSEGDPYLTGITMPEPS